MARTGITLTVFTLMNFVLAMMASVLNGILDKVAVSLSISVANAGLLNTMYSYGAAFGVPVVLILFRRVERTRMLKTMLFLTVLATAALVLVRDFGQMLAIRLAMGVSANSYSVLAISTVASLSSKERLGRSLAALIAGSASALVIGIPLTRALSSLIEWQSIFWILNAMMILALIYFLLWLPAGGGTSAGWNIREEIGFFQDRKVLQVIGFSLVMFVGYGALYTYITPYFLELFPEVEGMMTFVLVLLGMASFSGNLIGGQVSDRIGYVKSMLLGAALQVTWILLILLAQPVKWLSVAFAVLWLMSAWFTGLQLNTGIAQATQNKSSFMISMNSASIQLGTAVGSSLAAAVISLSGIRHIVYITLFSGLAVLAMQWACVKRDSREAAGGTTHEV